MYEDLIYFSSNLDQVSGYLKARGIDQEVSQEFELGYCPPSSNQFSGRLIFPIFNAFGDVIAFGGRSLGEEKPKYINSPESDAYKKSRVLYNLDKAQDFILKEKYALVVEGYFDVIRLWSQGFKNVVASCGTAITRNHVRLLKRFADEIVICYDGDSAGEKAAERALEGLSDECIPIWSVSLPGGSDPDDFVRWYGIEEFRKVIDEQKETSKFKERRS